MKKLVSLLLILLLLGAVPSALAEDGFSWLGYAMEVTAVSTDLSQHPQLESREGCLPVLITVTPVDGSRIALVDIQDHAADFILRCSDGSESPLVSWQGSGIRLANGGSAESMLLYFCPEADKDLSGAQLLVSGTQTGVEVLISSDGIADSSAEPEESTAPEEEPFHLNQYIISDSDVDSLLSAAKVAVSRGQDLREVGEELYGLAEDGDVAEELTWYIENYNAYGTEDYERFQEYFAGRSVYTPSWYHSDEMAGVSIYDCAPKSDELDSLLHGGQAQYCYAPVFWAQSDFSGFLGTSYGAFKPSSPRPGFACIVVKDGAQSAPKTKWADDSSWEFEDALEDTVADLMYALGDDCPVITGNPNLASTFWIFDMQYPFHGRYTGSVTGYNCTVSLTIVNTANKGNIASFSATERLADTIYSWDNWIAKADTPALEDFDGYEAFAEKVRAQAAKERSAAKADRKLTHLNAASVLDGILIAQAETVNDSWQKAIFGAGARGAVLEDGMLTFSLRSFNPDLAALGKYADAADGEIWLQTALENAAAYNLEISIPVENGQITRNGMSTLKNTVAKAAGTAKNAFNNREMTAALTAHLFPVPADTTAKDPADPLAFLAVAQKSLSANLNGGPHGIVLNCIGADPAELLKATRKQVLDAQAFVPAQERCADASALKALFLDALNANAAAQKTKANYRYTITVDIDELLRRQTPADFAEYLSGFNCKDTMDGMCEIFLRLPDQAAIAMPRTGKLSGSSSGTSVTFRLGADSADTYIQMRSAGADEMVVSCFINAGKETTVRVPQGDYIIVWGSGPYWYGEQDLFCSLGSYSKSESTEILGSGYRHTFTLERSDDGDVGFYSADPSDFR